MINVIGVGWEIDNLRDTDTGIWKPVEWNRNIVGYCSFQSNSKFWSINSFDFHTEIHYISLYQIFLNILFHLPSTTISSSSSLEAKNLHNRDQLDHCLLCHYECFRFPPTRQKNDNCWCGSAANKYNTTLFKHIVKSSCLQQIARAAPKVVVVDYSCWDLSFVLPKLLRRCVIRPHLAWTVVDVVVVVSRIRQL